MKRSAVVIALLSIVALASCGKKEEGPAHPSASSASSTVELVCSYAPSQSAVVANLSGAAGGSAAAVGALAQALGLTVVPHSSGALILTGGSGYIAGTLGAAAAGPVVIGAGVLVAGSAGVVELFCAPRNHPEMVAKVEAAAAEFALRSKATASSAASSVGSFAAERRVAIIKSGDEAVAYANRKSIDIADAMKRK